MQCVFGVANQVEFIRVAHTDPFARTVDLHRAGLPEIRKELSVGKVRSHGEQGVAVAHEMPTGGGAEQTDRSGDPGKIIGQHILAQQCFCGACS
ncbi:Uncharacterised protein [Mycobacteroides abscessus subsp. abscessus]|nr:Uncharacterised protein [Mycobacteroides abscessus subsp. abscessus]